MANEETAGWTVPRGGEGAEPLRLHPLDRAPDRLSYRALSRGAGVPFQQAFRNTLAVAAGLFVVGLIVGLAFGASATWIAVGSAAAVVVNVVLAPVSRAARRKGWQSSKRTDVLVLQPLAVARRTRKGADLVRWAALAIGLTAGQVILIFVPSTLLVVGIAAVRPDWSLALGSFAGVMIAIGTAVEWHVVQQLEAAEGLTSFAARPSDRSRPWRKTVRAQAHVQFGDEPEVAKVVPALSAAEGGPADVGALPIELQQALLHFTGRFDDAAALGMADYVIHPSASTAYRVACSLVAAGQRDAAAEWLTRAVDDGWDSLRDFRVDFRRLLRHPAVAGVAVIVRANAKRGRRR